VAGGLLRGAGGVRLSLRLDLSLLRGLRLMLGGGLGGLLLV
jgi:hypothetical protein